MSKRAELAEKLKKALSAHQGEIGRSCRDGDVCVDLVYEITSAILPEIMEFNRRLEQPSFGLLDKPVRISALNFNSPDFCELLYSTIGYPGLQFARFRISWLTDGIEADIEKAKKAKIEPLERKADKMAEKLGRLLEEIERIKSL